MTLDASILDLKKRNLDFESLTARDIVTWALERFNARLALACSFQAEESVLIDMLHRVCGSNFRIFT